MSYDMERDKGGKWLPHAPTEKTRAEVAALNSFGNTQEEIALYLGICVDTLAKHYRHELDTAVIKANAKVAQSLFNKAVNQDDLAAQIFWLKTRGRWRTADSQPQNAGNTVSEISDDVIKEKEKDY